MTTYSLDGVLPRTTDSWIAPGAHVIGNVELAPGVSVWFNAVIRGDNELIRIGTRTNIQDGSILHSDPGKPLTIGSDCTIGHGAIIHGCTIGDQCLIGMGATVLNRAQIGRGSIVGANALIREGDIFPDHSLIVGVPAKIVRTLAPDTADQLSAQAHRYVMNAKRFSMGLSGLNQIIEATSS